MASSALQICLILGFMVLMTAGWHCGLGRATERASVPPAADRTTTRATAKQTVREAEEKREDWLRLRRVNDEEEGEVEGEEDEDEVDEDDDAAAHDDDDEDEKRRW